MKRHKRIDRGKAEYLTSDGVMEPKKKNIYILVYIKRMSDFSIIQHKSSWFTQNSYRYHKNKKYFKYVIKY